VLRNASLRYALYGQVNAARDNVVLVCHALSGSAKVADWWPAVFHLPGLIDPERNAVLGVNILGSCYGSTGPASVDPATGKHYGASFPIVQIADIVQAQSLLLDGLGISHLQLAIGASLGGMQALAWAMQFPARIGHAIVIGAAPLNAMGLGLNHLQRQAIQLDPAWDGGNYTADAPPKRGLALARAMAVSTYKSNTLFDERFARNPDRSGEDPFTDSSGRFDIAGYLDHQGDKFNERFDANSYIALTRTMDLFDPARGVAEAYRGVQAKVTVVGISSDALFPVADVRALADAMSAAGVRCDYRELISTHGHDAFLAEPDALMRLLQG
jgi:homoserine O-acetyltransferase